MRNQITLQVGDFITIPAWRIRGGQVTEVNEPYIGSDKAQRVAVQEKPEQESRWYTLEPNEFTLEN